MPQGILTLTLIFLLPEISSGTETPTSCTALQFISYSPSRKIIVVMLRMHCRQSSVMAAGC